jgi:hypothetical protein
MRLITERASTFTFLVKNKVIIQPDLGTWLVVSHLKCAILCVLSNGCTVISMWAEDDVFICQSSKRKGTCMEKKEVYDENNITMFQNKVRTVIDLWTPVFLEYLIIKQGSKGQIIKQRSKGLTYRVNRPPPPLFKIEYLKDAPIHRSHIFCLTFSCRCYAVHKLYNLQELWLLDRLCSEKNETF